MRKNEDTNWSEGFQGSGYGYNEWGNKGMFQERNCMLLYLCNIFYHIVERFSLIRGCGHG